MTQLEENLEACRRIVRSGGSALAGNALPHPREAKATCDAMGGQWSHTPTMPPLITFSLPFIVAARAPAGEVQG